MQLLRHLHLSADFRCTTGTIPCMHYGHCRLPHRQFLDQAETHIEGGERNIYAFNSC